jgi:hypothetical protein
MYLCRWLTGKGDCFAAGNTSHHAVDFPEGYASII